MARCLTCGRRFRGDPPPCGHEQPPREHARGDSDDEARELVDLETSSVPGYQLHEVLGSGGFGVVLAATRESDGAAAAIKVGRRESDDARIRLDLEARALAKIGPPHVPAFYGMGTLEHGSMYLACERLYTTPLDEKLIDWQPPMQPELFVALADAIAEAVEAVHDHGFVHRDLKPENIFITESPIRARLIDFGIVKDLNAKTPGTTLVGMALGTPEYMAPEQCEGGRAIDHRADIYALGVLMYELLTGRPPFIGSAVEVRGAHVSRRPTPPSRVAECGTVFDHVILTCLAKKPERRFGDVASLRRELALAATQEKSQDPTQEAASPTRPDRKQRQLERMGIAFFETRASTGDVKHMLSSLGGNLASVEQSRCIAVFGRASSDNPVQRALDSAHALVAQGLCERVLVDQDRLRVRVRPDGGLRVFAAPLARDERFPRTGDPPGVLLTTAAADMLPEMHTVPVRDGVVREFVVSMDANTDTDVTMMQIGADTLVGRDAELADMLEWARTAFMNREPTITSVLAESGYGKSQLCASMLKQLPLVAPLAHVIHLRSREPLGGENNRTLRELLRATLGLPHSLPAAQGREVLSARLGDVGDDVWYAVAATMGWLSADAPELRRFSAAPMALRTAASQAAGRALRKLAEKSPVCVLLDDAHFADNATLDALEYATLPEAKAPIWVCVAALPSLEAARPSWGKRAAHHHIIALGRLDDEVAARLWRQLLAPVDIISDATIERLVQKTLGNPFLMTELARAIRSADLIRPRGRGHAHILAADELEELTALPQIEWLAARELATLPSELAAHARLVALLGAEVSQWEVEGVLGELERAGHGDTFPLDAQVGLHRLNVHGILLMRSGGSYSFRHQLIRAHVEESTPEELRTQIHRAAFRFYRDAHALPDYARLPKLAVHAAASGYRDEAVASYLKLATQASSRHNYMEAELMYSRALSLLPESEKHARMAAYNGRGLMRYRSSRYEDALDDLRRARELARALGDRQAEVSIVLDESTVLDWMMDFRESKERIDEARALAEDPAARSPLVEARLHLGEGRSHCRFNAYDKAVDVLERAIREAAELGNPGYETHVLALTTLGFAYSVQSQPERAEAALNRAIRLAEERGDKVHLGVAFSNRGLLWQMLSNLQRAIDDILRCRQIGREVGQSEMEYASSYNAAELYFFAGECDAAQVYLRRAVDMEPSNSKRPLSRLLEARIAVFNNDMDAARRVLGEIAQAQEHSRAIDDQDALFTDMEQVLFDMARLASHSDASRDDWHALLERASILPPLELAEFFEIAGLSAMRRSDLESATTLLERALATCRENSLLIEERVRNDLRRLAS